MENLKFRVWDKHKKQMIEWIDLDLSKDSGGDDITVFEPTGIVRDAFLMPILLQSTGLKDKNSVEIFEGDIVSCFNEGVSTVVFRYGTFGLLCNGYFEGFINVLGSFEVLGNIYENGDLLK